MRVKGRNHLSSFMVCFVLVALRHYTLHNGAFRPRRIAFAICYGTLHKHIQPHKALNLLSCCCIRGNNRSTYEILESARRFARFLYFLAILPPIGHWSWRSRMRLVFVPSSVWRDYLVSGSGLYHTPVDKTNVARLYGRMAAYFRYHIPNS